MAVPLLRTLILYCAVICAVRLMGKRQIGELDPSELVVTILVSDLAAVPMQDLGIPLLSGLVPIATLVVLEIFLSFAALKSRRFRRLLNGQPAIIIRRGQLDIDKLRQMRLTTDEVLRMTPLPLAIMPSTTARAQLYTPLTFRSITLSMVSSV